MKYETKEDFFKDSPIFRCQCGEYSFIEFSYFYEDHDDYEYMVTFIESPRGFLQKLKWFFKSDKNVRDIVLSKSDIISLGEWIKCKTE